MALKEKRLHRPKVAIYAMENFIPFHISVPWLTFHDSRLSGEELFDTVIFSTDPHMVTSSSLFAVNAPFGLEAVMNADIIVIPYWPHIDVYPREDVQRALVKAHQAKKLIVGLCLGAYVLGYAGLLAGRRATTHWFYCEDFEKRFPDTQLDPRALYIEDDNIITSAGTAASLDCCLYIVRRFHGVAVANQLARMLVTAPHREGGQAQFIDRPLPTKSFDERIKQLLQELYSELHVRHTIQSLAKRTLMSRRTFTRRFQSATGVAPLQWITVQRLHAAQEMLESTDYTVEKIADLTGFPSAASLRYHFFRRFNITPNDWRRNFQLEED